MYLFLCKLWPYLAGGLIGWLLCGWLARRLKFGEPPQKKFIEKKVEVEVEVEKVIDNPSHLTLITKLKKENRQIADLRAQIVSFKNAKPEVIEKEIEKIVEVDNPKHLERINTLEEENEQITDLQIRITELESRGPKVVEKNIEIDNPLHLVRINVLEEEIEDWRRGPTIDLPAAKAVGIKIQRENDFTAIEGIGPKINELIHAEGIDTFKQLSETEPATIQKILDKAGENFQMANPGTWPDQANLAASNRWSALKALQDILDGGVYPDPSVGEISSGQVVDNPEHVARISALEHELETLRNGPKLDMNLAKAAGFNIRRNDDKADFTIIEGIGPKIDELIHAAGIHTYKDLAGIEIADIQDILDKAGSNFTLAKPETWPDQSELAAENRWGILRKWQDVLDGGEE